MDKTSDEVKNDEVRYTKAPAHPKDTAESDMLMGVPFGMLRKDNPLTGLDQADLVRFKFKPKKITEVPTSQEVGDQREDEENEDEIDSDDDSDEIEVNTETEVGRLRHLLSSVLKSVMEYFCAKE